MSLPEAIQVPFCHFATSEDTIIRADPVRSRDNESMLKCIVSLLAPSGFIATKYPVLVQHQLSVSSVCFVFVDIYYVKIDQNMPV